MMEQKTLFSSWGIVTDLSSLEILQPSVVLNVAYTLIIALHLLPLVTKKGKAVFIISVVLLLVDSHTVVVSLGTRKLTVQIPLTYSAEMSFLIEEIIHEIIVRDWSVEEKRKNA